MIFICSRFPGNSALLLFDVRKLWWETIFRVRYHVISKETMREPVNRKKNPALELLVSH